MNERAIDSQGTEPGIAPPRDPLIGRVLAGRYEISRLIAEGGMGRVYQARQRALDRPVAVKCIHPYLLATDHMVVRFMEEARVASQLVHPNVVKIYDFGRTPAAEGGTLFIVMELLGGKDLATIIADQAPLSLTRSHAILRQVLSALGEAHARGITHRDAKPDNIIIEPTATRGELVKIIDFGIAKVHGARGVTSVGQFVGTPHYMSPEQIRGENSEVSADLYAVGVTMFQMLTGRLPFDAGTVTGVLEQQLYSARPDPRDVAPPGACPPALAQVCLRALAIDPAERYATADLFLEALDRAVLASQPPRRRGSSAPPVSGEKRTEVQRSDRVSSVPPRGLPVLGDGERVERSARAAIVAGRFDVAERELERGLALGRAAFSSGNAALGRSAVLVFSRLLAVVQRHLGRLDDSEGTLRRALPHAAADEVSRARLLAELVQTLGDAGRLSDAETMRVEALRLANALGDRVLIERLRRIAQSLALAVATRGSLPAGNPSRRSSPPPRRSEWRVRQDDGPGTVLEPPVDAKTHRG